MTKTREKVISQGNDCSGDTKKVKDQDDNNSKGIRIVRKKVISQ